MYRCEDLGRIFQFSYILLNPRTRKAYDEKRNSEGLGFEDLEYIRESEFCVDLTNGYFSEVFSSIRIC